MLGLNTEIIQTVKGTNGKCKKPVTDFSSRDIHLSLCWKEHNGDELKSGKTMSSALGNIELMERMMY